jgi:hypothetical protein
MSGIELLNMMIYMKYYHLRILAFILGVQFAFNVSLL